MTTSVFGTSTATYPGRSMATPTRPELPRPLRRARRSPSTHARSRVEGADARVMAARPRDDRRRVARARARAARPSSSRRPAASAPPSTSRRSVRRLRAGAARVPRRRRSRSPSRAYVLSSRRQLERWRPASSIAFGGSPCPTSIGPASRSRRCSGRGVTSSSRRHRSTVSLRALAAAGRRARRRATSSAPASAPDEPRFPLDLDTDSLPAEAGWDDASDDRPGEGMLPRPGGHRQGREPGSPDARHPPGPCARRARRRRARAVRRPPRRDRDERGRGVGLARVAWTARETDLRTSSGVGLEIRDPAARRLRGRFQGRAASIGARITLPAAFVRASRYTHDPGFSRLFPGPPRRSTNCPRPTGDPGARRTEESA